MANSNKEYLSSSMSKCQGYRILDGYPRPSLMEEGNFPDKTYKHKEGLIVCVLPHTMCNPQVEACGFCTFPHEPLNVAKMRKVCNLTIAEIEARAGENKRLVHALYFGGSTANLMPTDLFQKLVETVEICFDLTKAEVTLEGAPQYYLTKKAANLRLFSEMDVAQKRISMGIQTFDLEVIKKMGRSHFGDKTVVKKVLRMVKTLGVGSSGDFIINRPFQTLSEMKGDIRQAINLGFDQICLYNLVLRSTINTPWSQDKEMIANLPMGEVAFQNWNAVKEILISAGYVQTTISNFELSSVLETGRGFRYEIAGSKLDKYDVLGYGPRALSSFREQAFDVKVSNPASSRDYLHDASGDIIRGHKTFARKFSYKKPEDLLLDFVTRSIAILSIDRKLAKKLTGLDPVEFYSEQMNLMGDVGLIIVRSDRISLTDRGIFYSDSMIALLSRRRERELSKKRKMEAQMADMGGGM